MYQKDLKLHYLTIFHHYRRQRDKNDIGFLDGQVGEYKSGVQVLRKDDLKKLTSPQGSDGRGRYSRGRGGRR